MQKIILILFVLTVNIFGQITITSSDMANTFALGNSAQNHEDNQITSINIGSVGGGNNWDFTMLQSNINGIVTSVVPTSTPYSGSFPGANYANHTVLTYQDTTIDLYFYFTLSNKLEFMGSVSTINVIPGLETFVSNDPSISQAVLPMTYNSNWTENNTKTIGTKFNNTTINTITSTVTNKAVVDAYGTMTLPGLTSLDVLRLKEETTIITNGISDTYTRFTFISKEGAQASFTAVEALPSISGVIEIDGASYNGRLITDVQKTFSISDNYFLTQNYPNPFNPSTTLKYSISKQSKVTLKVFNVLGSELATLVNMSQPQGDYEIGFDGSDLTSGIYFYRFQADDFVKTKKMILMK